MAQLPKHIVAEVLEADRVGNGTAVTVTVFCPLQPKLLVEVTVKVVVLLIVTATCDPVNVPGFQVYVLPPVAVKFTVPPAHTEGLPAEATIVGFGFTDITCVANAVHPATLVPVAV